MHMIQMTGLVSALYFFTLGFLIFYREKINIKIGNLIFVIADVFFFFLWNYGYFVRGSLHTFITFDNISPFIFTVIPLTYIFKDSVKDYAFSAIAFLHFGMLCATFVSPEQAYLFNFLEEANMLYTAEAFCHMLTALFGIYLVLTEQVKPTFKAWVKSVIFMYSVITFGVLMNVIFHRSYFGMNPYGRYAIYFLDIFGSFGATLAAYYLGVLVVLTFGMQTSYGLMRLLTPREQRKKRKKNKAAKIEEPVVTEETLSQ